MQKCLRFFHRSLPALLHGLCDAILGKFGMEDAVDDKLLIRYTQHPQLMRAALCLAQSRELRTTDQDQGRACGIAQRGNGRFIERALFFQSCQWSQARCAAGVVIEKGVPGFCQTHQAQGMAGGCGIEHHVIIRSRRLRITDQSGKFIERRDLHRARSRKLFFHAAQCRIRQYPAQGFNEFFPIRSSSRYGIDIHRV